MTIMGFHRRDNIDLSIVLRCNDEEGTRFVIRKRNLGLRLAVALNDIIRTEAFSRKHKRGIKRIGGTVGCINRDGIRSCQLQPKTGRGALIVGIIALVQWDLQHHHASALNRKRH